MRENFSSHVSYSFLIQSTGVAFADNGDGNVVWESEEERRAREESDRKKDKYDENGNPLTQNKSAARPVRNPYMLGMPIIIGSPALSYFGGGGGGGDNKLKIMSFALPETDIPFEGKSGHPVVFSSGEKPKVRNRLSGAGHVWSGFDTKLPQQECFRHAFWTTLVIKC